MKIKIIFPFGSEQVEVVAVFGEAHLVRKSNGRHELVGGSRNDYQCALEWCSLFHHDLVFSRNPLSTAESFFAA